MTGPARTSDEPTLAASLASARTERHVNQADKLSVLMAAFGAAAIGALMYNILPLYLGSMEASKALASSQTGLIGTAFFLGFNIAGLSAFAWIRRFHWRTLSLLSMPLLFATLFGSAYIRSFPKLLIATALCGIAFGINYTIGSVIVGDTSRPERWYGVKVGLETLAGAAILFALPLTSAARYGFIGTVWAVAIGIALLLPLLFFLPRAWQKESVETLAADADRAAASPMKLVAIACAILALLVLFAGVSAIWAFSERMGRLSGFDEASIGSLLAITIITGIAGSFAAAMFGSRISPVAGFAGAVGIILVALIGLTIEGSFPIYTLANCLYMFGWAAGTPLAMAEIAMLDYDGRYISLIAPAIGLGGMIGPGMAGWLLEIGSPTTVVIYAASAIIASGSLMFSAGRLAR